MSLCPLSWKSVKRLNRETGEAYIAASAHNDGDIVAITPNGLVFLVTRQGRRVTGIGQYQGDTTTAAYLRRHRPEIIDSRISQEWKEELARRAEELDASVPA